PASGGWTCRIRAASRTPRSRSCPSRSPKSSGGRSAAMASTETTQDVKDARSPGEASDLAGLEAGLDALETVQTRRKPLRQTFTEKILPPVVAIALVLAVWQALISFKVVDDP